MTIRRASILGTGKYLPAKTVTDREMDRLLGVSPGWTLRKSDVRIRHFADTETASQMGARAAEAALRAAGLSFGEIDCLVCASGTQQQPIPCTAALIQREMGYGASGIPAFDINSTCLSFVVALDTVSCLIDAGRYKRVLIVSTEIASAGLNWEHRESAALFGDGAAAAVIGPPLAAHAGSQIVSAAMRTYGDGADLSEIRGGGSALHARQHKPAPDIDERFLFAMDGHGIYRMASRFLPGFVDGLLREAGCTMPQLKLVIPHQGSAMAMRLLSRKLAIAERQLMYITPDHGNTIAASIPMGLHEAIVQGRIDRGDRIMLLGTSAGLSLGGLILDY